MSNRSILETLLAAPNSLVLTAVIYYLAGFQSGSTATSNTRMLKIAFDGFPDAIKPELSKISRFAVTNIWIKGDPFDQIFHRRCFHAKKVNYSWSCIAF